MVADRVADGFIIPLPYGTGADWLRNVCAANRATVATQGQTYEVVEPEIVHAAAALPVAPKRRRVWQRIGIEQYVRLKLAS